MGAAFFRLRNGGKPCAEKTFYSSCVNWSRWDVDVEGGLNDLIANRVSIERSTFLRRVDTGVLRVIEARLGYAPRKDKGLTMADDWHVEYFRSTHHGETVYGFRHSAIEYVFK